MTCGCGTWCHLGMQNLWGIISSLPFLWKWNETICHPLNISPVYQTAHHSCCCYQRCYVYIQYACERGCYVLCATAVHKGVERNHVTSGYCVYAPARPINNQNILASVSTVAVAVQQIAEGWYKTKSPKCTQVSTESIVQEGDHSLRERRGTSSFLFSWQKKKIEETTEIQRV